MDAQRRLGVGIVLAAVPVIALNVAFKRQPDPRDVERYAAYQHHTENWVGRLAPEVDLELLDRSPFRLSEQVGRRIVVLNFFATWCGPCRAELPELERFRAQHADDPILIVGVDAERRELVEGFVRELGVSFDVALDASGGVQRAYGIESYPTTVVVGVDGRVHLYQAGAIFNADVAFARIVDRQLEVLRAGGGISREAFLAAQPTDARPGRDAESAAPEPELQPRARNIAQAMACPCGCSHTVEKCTCATAGAIKRRLAEDDLDGRTDVEVIRDLNAEFCMGPA